MKFFFANRNFNRIFFAILCVAVLGFLPFTANAQTPGLIYKRAVPVAPATTSPLDLNGDGYTSSSTAGFINNDIAESEIQYRSIPQLSIEPSGDLGPGPACSFTDMVDLSSDQRAVGMFVHTSGSDTNYLFRFRLGGSAPNSKGYSILIDTDGKFGFTGANADPNARAGNPGFEMEILLATNFGVRLYNVDGIGSAGTPVLHTTLPYANYAQKSIAHSTNCGDADYFYDFYIPLSVIKAYFPTFNGSKTIRLAGNTVIAPQSAIQGPISDLGGVNDATYGRNPDAAWMALITGSTPVAPNAVVSQVSPFTLKSVSPTVGSPLLNTATSVNITNTETSGYTLIYKNGVKVDSFTFNAAGTTNRTMALAANDVITAYTVATGKSISDVSNSVTVGGTCSAAPVIGCNTAKGISAVIPAGANATNIAVRLYRFTNTGVALVATLGAADIIAANEYFYKCNVQTQNCQSGSNCMLDGTYYFTMQETGKCESAPSTTACYGTQSNVTVSGITPTTITTTTTQIAGTGPNVTTTRVRMFVNGYLYAAVNATATGWTIPVTTALSAGDLVTFTAQAAGQCMSAYTTAMTVTRQLVAPVVSSPVLSSATSISGTSNEAAGTTITVFRNGVSIGTAIVTSIGTWTLNGVTLTAGQNITATASATGFVTSATSNTVTVTASTAIAYTPTITGSYSERDSIVSGTMTAPNGTLVAVYVDGYSIGTATVSGNAWSLTGISTSPADLYAGAKIIAYATSNGAIGTASNEVTVGCAAIGGTNVITVLNNPICEDQGTTVRIDNAEEGVVYTLRNNTNTANLSTSRLGLGTNLVIPSNALSTSQRIRVQAIKIGRVNCPQLLANSDSVTVYPLPTGALSLSASTNPACAGTTNNAVVANSQIGVKYQLKVRNGSNVGPSIKGTGAQLALPTGTLLSSTTFEVVATDTTRPTQCSRSLNDTIRITINPVTVSNAGSNQNLSCGTTSTTLAGNTATNGTGEWTKISGNGNITTPNSPTSGVTGLTSGAAVFRWSISNGINGCSNFSDVTIRVNCASVYTVINTWMNQDTLRNGDVLASATDPDGTITGAALTTDTIPAGLKLNADGRVTVEDRTTIIPGNYDLSIITTDNLGGTTTQMVSISIVADQEAVYTKTTPKLLSDYNDYDILASVTDANGAIFKAYQVAGGITPGVALNTTTGEIYVSDKTLLTEAPFIVDIVTKDNTGGTSTTRLTFNRVSPIPVDLINFTATLVQNKVKLNWSTAMEINNDYFDVERSKNGVNFEKIGEVKGNGNSNAILNYNFTDENPYSGISYYRLKQNDFNGDFEYSNIVAIRNNAAAVALAAVEVFPNPSEGRNITVALKNAPKENVTIEIYDMLGKRHFFNNYQHGAMNAVNTIVVNPATELSTGIYNMVITTEGNTYTKLIMVK